MTRQKLEEVLASSEYANEIVAEVYDYIAARCEYGAKIVSLTSPQKNFYLNQIFETEINNGGFSHYFLDSFGTYAEETIASLDAIKAMKTANILRQAIGKFPKATVPKNNKERKDVLRKIENKNDEIWNELESAFYEYEEKLSELNLNYIKQNIEEF